MRTLVLGGTAWLGRHLATTAAALGHEVICLARGTAGSAPPGVALVRADRDELDAYEQVRRQRWDLVLDVARQPGHVRRAVEALEPSSGAYALISSGNVYADHSTPGADETARLLPALDGDVMHDMTTYGPAKVACEQHVLRAFGPDRSLLARVGLIGGPGDPFDRSGYWPLRFARPSTADRRVLVPDAPDLLTAVIDSVTSPSGWSQNRPLACGEPSTCSGPR